MSACSSCGARIWWAKTQASNKPMPLNPEPTEDGNAVEVGREGRTVIVRILHKDDTLAVEGLRYVPHFATCPSRDQHKKPKP